MGSIFAIRRRNMLGAREGRGSEGKGWGEENNFNVGLELDVEVVGSGGARGGGGGAARVPIRCSY